MPGYTPQEILAFSGTVTPDAVKAASAYPAAFVRSTLIQLSNYLIGIADQPTLFGRGHHDPYSVSLRTLHDRLHIGRFALSPIYKEASNEEVINKTLGKNVGVRIEHRDLQDFEDLFFAVIARLQEMRHTLNMWLSSQFVNVRNVLFEGGPTIQAFHSTLAEYWELLNEPAFVRAIDNAVRRTRLEYTAEQIKALVESNAVDIEDAVPCLQGLYDSWDTANGINVKIIGWSPAMIAAYLEARYRTVLGLEKAVDQRKVREAKRKLKTKTSSESMKRRRSFKRSSGETAGSGKRPQLHLRRRSSIMRSGPAKSVRFEEPILQGKKYSVQDKTQHSDHTKHQYAVRDISPQHDFQSSIIDSTDAEAQIVQQERALQAGLHRDIERSLFNDVIRSSYGDSLDSIGSGYQGLSSRISNVGNWEHFVRGEREDNEDEMEY